MFFTSDAVRKSSVTFLSAIILRMSLTGNHQDQTKIATYYDYKPLCPILGKEFKSVF